MPNTIPKEKIREAWNDYVLSCEPKGTCVAEFVSHIPSGASMEGFSAGYLAHAAKHAEEVAKKDKQIDGYLQIIAIKEGRIENLQNICEEKDAEIERLEAEAGSEKELYQQSIGSIGNELNKAKEEGESWKQEAYGEAREHYVTKELLTAAREREEPLVSNVEKPLCMGLSIFSGDDGVWLYFKTKNGNSECLNISSKFREGCSEYNPTLLQWAKEVALAAYDSSRATGE